MTKYEFKLKDEYINLVQLLKFYGIISTGGEISHMLEEQLITYNGEIEYRKRKKLYSNDVVVVNEEIEITIK